MTKGHVRAAALAAAAVTTELMVAGAREAGSPWAPINAVAPLVLDPDAASHPGWHPTVTPTGLAITISGIAAWAVLHRLLLREGRRTLSGSEWERGRMGEWEIESPVPPFSLSPIPHLRL